MIIYFRIVGRIDNHIALVLLLVMMGAPLSAVHLSAQSPGRKNGVIGKFDDTAGFQNLGNRIDTGFTGLFVNYIKNCPYGFPLRLLLSPNRSMFPPAC
jgi:hypothetical protein